MSTTADELPPRAPGVMIERMSKALNILVAKRDAVVLAPSVIELYFTADELSRGGMVTISMWVDVDGVDELFSAWLALRPGTSEGAVLRPSVLLPRMQPVEFRVRERASGAERLL